MQFLFIYILKAILISGILLGYYWIGLRNTRFHFYNRFYLVASVLLSLALPLLDLEWFILSTPESAPVQQVVQFIYQSEGITSEKEGLTWDQILVLSLSLVSATLVILFGVGVLKIYLLKSRAKVIAIERFDFIETALEEAPFSFFRNLFWRSDLPVHDETGQRMLKHELTHIEQFHSYDKVFVTLTTNLFWMNPFFWLIRKELEVVHEFIADEAAVAGDDAAVLAEMLLMAHYHSNSLSVGQSFFYSSIKRRIIMLTSSKKTSYSYLRRLIVLPLAFGLLTILSFTVSKSIKDVNVNSSKKLFSLINPLDTMPMKAVPPFDPKRIIGSYLVEVKGDFTYFKDPKTKKLKFSVPTSRLVPPPPPPEPGKPGASRIIVNGREISPADLDKIDPSSIKTIDIRGTEEGVNVSGKNKNGMTWAEATSADGKKIVTIKVDSVMFDGKAKVAVPTEGKVSNIHISVDTSDVVTVTGFKKNSNVGATIVRASDDKVVEKAKTDPNEPITVTGYKKNSNVSTITFRTTDDKVVEEVKKDPKTLTVTTTDKDGKKTITYVQKHEEKTEIPKDVLYIVDGKELQSGSMKDIDPNSIKSINVLKGETAAKLYGEKGKNGVIEIITKKN